MCLVGFRLKAQLPERVFGQRDDAEVMFVGKGQRFGPVEKERFARVHGETAVVLFDEEADGLQPDRRQIHAFVLFGLEAFDRHATFAAQFTAARIRQAAQEDPVDVSALVPTAPIDCGAAMEDLRRAAASITDPDYRAVAEAMLEAHGETLASIPAAKSVHHAFLGGLLMHTANMVKIADFLAGMYPETIDRSLLLTGTLLHDMAKAQEFVFSQLGLATDYSIKGQLLGHLVMGAQDAAETAARLGVPEEKSVLLQHLILSHHGEPEFGAAVRPLCAEAELLSLIDAVDSRMEIYRETYDTMEPDTFSPRIFALEKKVFRHA